MRQSAGRNVLAAWYEHRSSFVKRLYQCAQIVLNSTSLQLIPAHSSQSDLPPILWTLVSVWTISM